MCEQVDSDRVFQKFTSEGEFSTGSFCSGLDSGNLGRAFFYQEWNRLHPERPLRWRARFVSEAHEPTLRAAVAAQPDLQHAFTDAHQVADGRAWDIISGSWREPPEVTWLDVSVPCKDFSSLNPSKRKRYETGESDRLFDSACIYIERKRPRYVMYENVLGAYFD